MKWFIPLCVLALGISHISYLCRFQIRRWWRGNLVNRNLPPHQRWPEILHWQAGDRFESLYDLRYTLCTLVALEEDGYAIVNFFGDKDWVPISKLIGKNVSLRTRQVNADLKNSVEYMELIKQFNIAFEELQERDRRNGITQ